MSEEFATHWRALLHYSQDVQPDVVSSTFYLTKNKDPVEEYQFFFQKIMGVKPRQPSMQQKSRVVPKSSHHQKVAGEVSGQELICRFPARYLLLSLYLKQLPEFDFSQCQEFSQFLEGVSGEHVSLVITSEHFKNAGSMFGHMMLVIHQGSHVLPEDRALHFATGPVGKEGGVLLHMFRGLSGGYTGLFFNDDLSRKIYEYVYKNQRYVFFSTLNLTDRQRFLLKAHLFELRAMRFPYFFLKENCAAQIDRILSAVLNKAYHESFVYTLPADVFRKFDYLSTSQSKMIPDMVRTKHFLHQLDSVERQAFNEIVKGQDTLKKEDSVRLHSALFYYDRYQKRMQIDINAKNAEKAWLLNAEPKVGERQVLSVTEQVPPIDPSSVRGRQSALPFQKKRTGEQRANQLRQESVFFEGHWDKMQPVTRKPKPFKVSLGAVVREKTVGGSLSLRPLFVDMESIQSYQPREFQINLLNITMEWWQNKFFVEEIDVFSFRLLNDYTPPFTNVSWSAHMGFNRDNIDREFAHQSELGIGLSSYLQDGGGVLNGFLTVGMHLFLDRVLFYFSPELNIFYYPMSFIKVGLQAKYKQFVNTREWILGGFTTLQLASQIELTGRYRYKKIGSHTYSLSLRYFL